MSNKLEKDIFELWKTLTTDYPKYLWGYRERDGKLYLSIMEHSSRGWAIRKPFDLDLNWKEYMKQWTDMYKEMTGANQTTQGSKG